MNCVDTAAACLAATSSFLMAFFLRAAEAAALVTALRCSAARRNCSWAASSYKMEGQKERERGIEIKIDRSKGREGERER